MVKHRELMGSLPRDPSLQPLPACYPSNSCSTSVSHLLRYQGAPGRGSPGQSLGLETEPKKMWQPPTPRAAGSGETDTRVTRTHDGPAKTAVLKRTAPDSAKMRLSPDGGERWRQSRRSPWHWVPCRFLRLAGLECPCPCSSFRPGECEDEVGWSNLSCLTHAMGFRGSEAPNGLCRLGVHEAWGVGLWPKRSNSPVLGGWDCQALPGPPQQPPTQPHLLWSSLLLPSVARRCSTPTMTMASGLALTSQGLSGAAGVSSHLSTRWPCFSPCCFPLLLGGKHMSSRGFSQPNCYSRPHLFLPAKARSWPETKRMSRNSARSPASQAPTVVWMGPSLRLEAQTQA